MVINGPKKISRINEDIFTRTCVALLPGGQVAIITR